MACHPKVLLRTCMILCKKKKKFREFADPFTKFRQGRSFPKKETEEREQREVRESEIREQGFLVDVWEWKRRVWECVFNSHKGQWKDEKMDWQLWKSVGQGRFRVYYGRWLDLDR